MRRACDNPFAVHRVLNQRYRMSDSQWTLLHRRFEAVHRRGAIIGQHGCGKTTLLEDFARHLEANGWTICWYRFDDLARRPQHLPRFGANELVICDGAEQLSRWDWWRLRHASRKAGGLLITTHQSGRLPTLYECRAHLDVVRHVVWELDSTVPQPTIDRLHAEHAGNARDVIRALYDAWSGG